MKAVFHGLRHRTVGTNRDCESGETLGRGSTSLFAMAFDLRHYFTAQRLGTG